MGRVLTGLRFVLQAALFFGATAPLAWAGSFDGMALVPAGEFIMGSEEGVGNHDEYPARPVYLDSFYIDKHETTVAQYERCIAAGRCEKASTARPECNISKKDRKDHPVNCMNWKQARTYCVWAGKRLPTEAQWEKAARGAKGGLYPWGNEPATCRYAVIYHAGAGCGESRTFPVGSKPDGASPYGVMDMAGNLWEWTADWYDPRYYEGAPSRNPTGPKSGTVRSVRGGSWLFGAQYARSANRNGDFPEEEGEFHIGFRCAASPD